MWKLFSGFFIITTMVFSRGAGKYELVPYRKKVLCFVVIIDGYVIWYRVLGLFREIKSCLVLSLYFSLYFRQASSFSIVLLYIMCWLCKILPSNRHHLSCDDFSDFIFYMYLGITHTIMHHICLMSKASATSKSSLNSVNHFCLFSSWWPFCLQPAKVFFLKPYRYFISLPAAQTIYA